MRRVRLRMLFVHIVCAYRLRMSSAHVGIVEGRTGL